MTMHTTKAATTGKAYGVVGDTDTYIASSAADTLDIVTGGTTGTQFVAAGPKADVIAEKTAGAGVTIDGLLIKDGEVQATGTVRAERIAVKALAGATLQAGVQAWQNPTGSRIIVTRAILDVTTVATGAATVDVGVTPTSATTASDTLLDGVDVNAAVAIFDSGDAGLDTGANDMAQSLAAGKWVTIKSATGDTTGMVANLYIYYIVA